MAVIPKRIAEFTVDGAVCAFEYDYDDGTLRVVAFRCINNTLQPAYGWVARNTNYNVFYEATFLPLTTFEVSVSQGAANRLQLEVLPNGKLDGLETSFRVPAIL